MKVSLSALITFMVIFFGGCKNESQKATIGFMVPTFEVARYKIDRDNFVKRANELGAQVIVTDAGNDDKKQIEQGQELINKGVSAIVIISVNQFTAAAIVRYARNKNVPVIAYNRMIQNADLDLLICVDIPDFGRQMAEYAVKQKPSGNYLIISGDKSDHSSVETHMGQMEVLKSHIASGEIKILYDRYVEDWMPEEAYHLTKEFLNLSGQIPDVILSGNDGMAGGIIQALKENGLEGKVVVTGLDAELAACKRIINGTQSMTIYMPLKAQAYLAASAAVDLINKKTPHYDVTTFNGKIQVPTLHLKTITVDKDNILKTVVADGMYKESDLY